MLSQVVLASVENRKWDRPPGFSATSISSCPYATYIAYKRLNPYPRRLPTIELLLEDGLWQERQVVFQLERAGFEMDFVLDRQAIVEIGLSRITGHPDGIIKLKNHWDMLEVKSMSMDRFTLFKQKGISSFPGIKCQVQVYMHSGFMRKLNIEGCWVYVKHKDSCRPFDTYEEYDPNFIGPIVEVTDRIILDGYEPEKIRCNLCPTCRNSLFCWEEIILDASKVKIISLPEASERWKVGKVYKSMGTEMMEESKDTFKKELGSLDLMYVDDLKVSRIIQHRVDFNTDKFGELFGFDKLPQVMVEKPVEQIRISLVGEK